ncbi:MAG: amino acid adenylation domain-containing protein [Bacillota bacterium]|nr:amino acid adenylation domain-containing protein [Bacillota bacterium]
MSKFDITLTAVEVGEEISLNLEYCTKLFKRESIERIRDHFINILKEIAENPEKKISEIEMLTEEEKRKILVEFNDTKAEYPKNKTIYELFEEQVEKTPGKIAVVYEEKELSYRELNERANQLARLLREKGVVPDKIVGIMVERSLDMIVGIMGILKAGGAYLPIDSEYPNERIEYMLKDSGTEILLTQKQLVGKIKFSGNIIEVNREELYVGDSSNLKKINTPNDLAYIIYTSGTTGFPKGVLCEHKNVIRLVKNTNYIEFNKDDKILQTGSMVFDASTFEVWGALLNGIELYLAKKEIIMQAELLEEFVTNHNITILWLTSELFNQIADANLGVFKNLRYLLVGGDVLSIKYINLVRRKYENIKIINGYGPTENTTFSTIYLIEKTFNSNIPIGKPISNSNAYILDKNNKLMPIGVYGELCVSGDGLSRGYLNRIELTSEKFIENPYKPRERMYKTGDLARWLPDGNIEFKGRIDHQVKIRGFRIELGEIESRLLKHEEIKEAVVIDREDKEGNKYLCGYVVSNKEMTVTELREHLSKELPDYMVPAYFIQLEKIPLTSNGKADRKALPAPDGAINTGVEYTAPRNEIEQEIAKVWSQVLGVDKIGIDDNFFALGGDSIKAIQITARLGNSKLKINISKLFKNPSIRALSANVRRTEEEISQSIVEGTIELTAIQEWFVQKEFTNMNHWNQAFMLYSKEGFDEDVIREAFTRIIEHHDALRIVIKKEQNSLKVYNRGITGKLFDLRIIDLRYENSYADKILDEANKIQASIDIFEGPLVKLGLFKTSNGDHLLIAIHHLAIDGVSWRILFEDFNAAYKQAINREKITLPEKTHSFKTWSERMQNYAKSSELLNEIDYWSKIEKTKIESLPRDNETVVDNKVKNSAVSWMKLLTKDTENLLMNTNYAYNTEINDILLAALGLTIKDWTGENKVLINLEGHGREEIVPDINISRTVGWFTSQYPLILNVTETDDIGYYIKSVKEDIRKIPNKGIGYGILKYITPKEYRNEIEFKLIPQISFNYLGQFDKDVNQDLFTTSVISAGTSISEESQRIYDININGMVIYGELQLSFQYNKEQYNSDTIEKLAISYEKMLLKVINHCIEKEESEMTPSDYGYDEYEYIKLMDTDSGISIGIEDVAIRNKIKEKEYYEASPAQKRMYMLQSFDKKSIAYNSPMAFEFSGVLDVGKVQKVFKKLIERHETLRTSFKLIDDEIMQKIHKYEDIDFKFDIVELVDESDISGYIQNFVKAFDLEKAPLLRGSIIKVSEEKYILLCDIHHINFDAASKTILIEEFWMLYEDKNLEKLEVQYKDYSVWQNKIYNSSKSKMQEKYWLSKFEGDLPRLELPTDYPRGLVLDFNGDFYDFELKEELLKRLREICKDQNVTLFSILFSAYNIILSKITNQEDIVVGAPVNCRNHIQLEKVIGIFLNTIAIRSQPKKNITFREFLKEVNKNIIEGMENQDYQFEMLIEKLNVLRELNRTPIFDTIMNFKSMNKSSNSDDKIKFSIHDIGREQAKFDITMYVTDLRDTVKISCNYRTSLFKRETIEYLMIGFLNLLNLISTDIEKYLKEYNIFSKTDVVLNKNKLAISDSYNRFEKEEINQSIIERFERVVAKYPNNIAVKTNKDFITYDLLNKRVNKLSQSILKSTVANNKSLNNIKPQTVALLCNHDIEMIVAMLGALRTGVIFVPLDPTYPKDRLIYMLRNSEAAMLISDSANITLAEKLKEYLDKDIFICEIDENICDEKYSKKVEAEQIAYIMYTSGSTGEPKGVVQTNENVLAFLCGYTNEFNINDKDKITLLSSYSHTTGIIDIFSALLNGATLCPYDIKSEGNMDNLVKWIEDEEITIYHSVPSVYRYYMNCVKENKNSMIRLIILGGESLHKSDVELYKKNFADDCIFVNLFGSSEVIVATSYLISKETEMENNIVPIGYLVDNVECYIINENGEEESVYGVGEIVYSSKYLAKGYWNLENKTKEGFITNPITKTGVVYRSGDIGRILPDGRLEYLGRADYQVKIRGYRVEVSEIESVLDKIDSIEKSVVVAYEEELGEKYLAAYFVVKDGKEFSLEIIKNELKNTLPSYMIPLFFKEIEEVPLTPNGKIDKKALPKIEFEVEGKEYAAPTNEIEKKLVEIWEEILKISKIGINDNFFDLGGHSLKATLLVGRIYKEFDVKVELKDIFNFSTVREISEQIKSKEKNIYEIIEKLGVQEWYETSSAQKRMYLMQQVDKESIAYNIPYTLEIVGKIELSRIKETFFKLIERHESLRTSFKLINDKILQKIHKYEDINFEFDVVELKNESDINSYFKNFIKVFDLEKAPLIRGGIIRVSEEKHILLWDIHHIVCDGTSMGIFMTEFWKVYGGKELEPVDLQYKDYSAWQAKRKQNKELKKQEEYWLQELSGEIPILNLSTDYPRPKLKSFEGDSISFVLDKEITNKLKCMTKETRTTMYMVLLSTVNILLSKYSYQEEIIVGTTIAGRNHRELEKIIGMFVNTLAIKSTVDSKISFEEYLKNIKETTLKAYENQDYQFEELVERLGIERDLSRNPLFDVMFSLQNTEKAEVLADGLILKQDLASRMTSKFDISITAIEVEEGIIVLFEYCTKLFKKQTIQKMADDFINIINEITNNRYVKLSDILLLNTDQLEEVKNEIEDLNYNIEFDF